MTTVETVAGWWRRAGDVANLLDAQARELEQAPAPTLAHETMRGLQTRARLWLGSVRALDWHVHYQALAAAGRSTCELAIDCTFVLNNDANAAKVRDWEDSHRFAAATRLTNYAATHATQLVNVPRLAVWRDQNADRIKAMRIAHGWVRRGSGAIHPSRWNGNGDLEKFANEADALAPDALKPYLAGGFGAFYNVALAHTGALIHGSSLVGLRGTDEETIHAYAGLAYNACTGFGQYVAGATAMQFGNWHVIRERLAVLAAAWFAG